MLETYPWYLVYGCYGSLLEAHICDIEICIGTYIAIWLRHISWYLVESHHWDYGTFFWHILWYMFYDLTEIYHEWYGIWLRYIFWNMVCTLDTWCCEYIFDVWSMWVALVDDDDVSILVTVTVTVIVTMTYTLTMEVTDTVTIWLLVSVVVTGWVYFYISWRQDMESKGSHSLLLVGAGETRGLEPPSICS